MTHALVTHCEHGYPVWLCPDVRLSWDPLQLADDPEPASAPPWRGVRFCSPLPWWWRCWY